MSGPGGFSDLFSEATISTRVAATTKEGVLTELVDVCVGAGRISAKKRDAVLEALFARESLGSTGIGGGIAIPHVKTDDVNETIAAIGVAPKRVDFKAVDGEPCNLFFLLVSPKSKANAHLDVLRWLSKLVRNPDFCRFLRTAGDSKEALAVVRELGA